MGDDYPHHNQNNRHTTFQEPLIPSHHPHHIRTKSLNRVLSHSHDELSSFRTYLRWMCVDQSDWLSTILSWFMFLIFAVAVPGFSHFVLACSDCDAKHERPYDSVVQLSLSSVAALAFVSLAGFVRKYGLRRFLFFDKLCDESENVRRNYTEQLNRSLMLCSAFVLPCFALETAYKIWWYASGASRIPFLGNVLISDTVACLLELLSWLYRTTVFFLVCVLFRLICHLQLLRLQDFARVFQVDSDVSSVLSEHLRIRRHLRIISHRFRRFILIGLVLITVSQFASLLMTTKSSSSVSIYIAGELALCSMTLMAGLMIILRSATKITHKAQSITCLAAKWNVCATIDSFVSATETNAMDMGAAGIHNSSSDQEAGVAVGGEEGSDMDDEGVDDDELDNTKLIPSYAYSTLSFQKRQALVTYFEHNRAGITVFGWTLDRAWLQLIFGIEMSLVLWLLGKTVGI